MAQASFHCPRCKTVKLFTAENMNHTPHILASVFLCGLWLPVWLILFATHEDRYHCQTCGYSAALPYLINPNLAAEQARTNTARSAEAAERKRQIDAGLIEPNWFDRVAESQYTTVAVIAVPVIVVIIGLTALLIFTQGAQNPPPKPTPTATPAPSLTPSPSPPPKKKS